MLLDDLGASLIGAVVGWVLVLAVRRKGPDWVEFCGTVVVILAGSALLNLIQTGLLGYFWIGIFAGFLANILIRRLRPAWWEITAPPTETPNVV